MRAVMVQAARELALWTAYEQTRFVVAGDGREITICAGGRNPKLDRLLASRGAIRWAFLTAYNPEPVRLSAAENTRRQQQLVDQLLADGYSPLAGEGRDPLGKWPAEPSVLVPNIGRREARKIGRDYGQLAILVGHAGFPARLVASGLTADRQRMQAV
jgi:hypothetical protein